MKTFEEFCKNQHELLSKAPYYFWAKKFDKVTHIPYPHFTGKSGVCCDKYPMMLGNNYAWDCKELCPECLKKIYELQYPG